MTDAEIKKALVWHSNDETHCSGCPYEEHSVTHYCVDMVIQDALDLINRQQAEIERFKKTMLVIDNVDVSEDELREMIRKMPVQIFPDTNKRMEAEAIKEFAERLKEELFLYCETVVEGNDMEGITDVGYRQEDTIETIDNLVKEMVGDAE